MSVKSCESLEKSMVALTVEVEAADLDAAIEQAYRKQRGKIRVPGFRPGKASRKIVERVYGANFFYEDAVNTIWPNAYQAAVKEKDLRTVGYPHVELLHIGPDGFTFKATVAVYPEVTLGQYKDLEVPRSEVTVTEADVEARLHAMADRNSRMVTLERPAEMGDFVNIDFKGYIDGEAFEGGADTDYDLELGSGQFVPGFEEQVVGMSAGEERDINVTFPETYHANLAGKSAVFHVTAHAVRHKDLPALDDEFAMDVSEFDTLDELRQDLNKKIREERETAQRSQFEVAALQKATLGVTCDVPDDMIRAEAEHQMDLYRQQVESRGIHFEDYLKMMNQTEETLIQQAWGASLENVREQLTAAAIADAEGLEATEEEVEEEYKKTAGPYGMEVDDVKKEIPEDIIRTQIRSRKAMAFIADHAIPVAMPTPEVQTTTEPESGEGELAPKAEAAETIEAIETVETAAVETEEKKEV